MSIKTSKRIVLLNSFLAAYKEQVAKRLGLGGWNVPKKWNNNILKIVDNAVTCRIDSAEDMRNFVKAQFDYFDYKACLKIFRLKYPPISVFLNPNARQRYRDRILKEESYASKILTNDDIMRIINSETSKHGNNIYYWNSDKIKFALINGTLSVYTLAYHAVKNTIKYETIKDCISYASQYVPEDLQLEYRQAVDRINKIINVEGVKHGT